MKFVGFNERHVYEMVFESPQGRMVNIELDEGTFKRAMQQLREQVKLDLHQGGFSLDRADRANGETQEDCEDRYDRSMIMDQADQVDQDEDVLNDVNERLAAMGLPLVDDDQDDDVDQL